MAKQKQDNDAEATVPTIREWVLLIIIAAITIIFTTHAAIITVEIFGPPETLMGLFAIAMPWAILGTLVISALVKRIR